MRPSQTLPVQRGFTLVEVIAVLIIMGILAAIAMTRSGDPGNVQRSMEEYRAVVRYAQSRALNTESVWRIDNLADKYALYSVQKAAYVVPPGMEGDSAHWISLPKGLSFITDGNCISFDSWGVPYTDQNATAKQGADRQISITDGSSTASVTLYTFTGFIS